MESVPLLGMYLGAGIHESSPLDLPAIGAAYRPSTMDVVASDVESAVSGVGSIYSVGKRLWAEYGPDDSKPLSKTDWEASPFYRKEVPYEDWFTENDARAFSEAYDARRSREFVSSRATTGQRVLGGIAGFGAGVFEPGNVASGIAASAVVGPAGGLTKVLSSAVPKFGEMLQTAGAIKKGVGFSAVEGLGAAAITDPIYRSDAKAYGSDYTTMDSVMNYATSAVFGGVLGGAHAWWNGRRSRPGVVDDFDRVVSEVESMGPASAVPKVTPTDVRMALDESKGGPLHTAISELETTTRREDLHAVIADTLNSGAESSGRSLLDDPLLSNRIKSLIDEDPVFSEKLSTLLGPEAERLKAERSDLEYKMVESKTIPEDAVSVNRDAGSIAEQLPERDQAILSKMADEDGMDVEAALSDIRVLEGPVQEGQPRLSDQLREAITRNDSIWNTLAVCTLRGIGDSDV